MVRNSPLEHGSRRVRGVTQKFDLSVSGVPVIEGCIGTTGVQYDDTAATALRYDFVCASIGGLT